MDKNVSASPPIHHITNCLFSVNLSFFASFCCIIRIKGKEGGSKSDIGESERKMGEGGGEGRRVGERGREIGGGEIRGTRGSEREGVSSFGVRFIVTSLITSGSWFFIIIQSTIYYIH